MASRSASASIKNLIVQNISDRKHDDDTRKRLGRKKEIGIGMSEGKDMSRAEAEQEKEGKGMGCHTLQARVHDIFQTITG